MRAYGAGRSSTALPARLKERAPGSLHFALSKGSALPFFCGHAAAQQLPGGGAIKFTPEQQTTNLGVRSSNLFGRASNFNHLH
jgi:hypothetical protein